MNTADYALIVSICSSIVAVLSFCWNVWSKFIYPLARLNISWQAITILEHGVEERPRFIAMNITNHGPTETTVHCVSCKFRRPWLKRPQNTMLNPIHNIRQPNVGVGPFGGGLPKKLAVGETFSLYFPFAADSFARDPIIRIGVADVFGKFHGARRKDIRAVATELDRAFPDIPPPNHIQRMDADD